MKPLYMREAYVEELWAHTHRVMTWEMPEGMASIDREKDSTPYWLALLPTERILRRSMELHLEGTVSKERLDEAAVNYLHAFREQAKLFKEAK